MRIGIAGARLLSKPEEQQAERILKTILSCYGEGDELHHGNQNGIDQLAIAIAKKYKIKPRSHTARSKKWEGVAGFKARNIEIVQNSDRIIIVNSATNSTNGIIWLYNYAEEQRKPCEWIQLGTDFRDGRRRIRQ